jgi:hypothetical protein
LNILVVQPDPDAEQALVGELVEFGHDAVGVDSSDATPTGRGATGTDVLVVCLDPDADQALVIATALLDLPAHRGTQVLFSGGEEAGLLRALELFPKANFTRSDALHTALASLGA